MSGGVKAGPRPRITDAGKRKAQQKANRILIVRTLFLLAVCGVVAFAVLAVRLYDLQIANSAGYEARALSGQTRETIIEASRGTIYDSQGRVLAVSGPVENVFISPLELEEKEQDVRFIAEGLSYILGVDYGFILEMAGRTPSQYQLIKAKIDEATSERVREFIKDNRLRGVYLEPATLRYYPNGTLASQILGFVGTDNTGLDGLEFRYNTQLSGVNGRDIRITNAYGSDLMLAGYGDYYEARHGSSIGLTIDTSIQYYVEKHLEQAIIDYDVLGGGMAIAIDPRTGEILALANYPTFDPNDFLKISDADMERLSAIEDEEEFIKAYNAAQLSQWRNRALADAYEPGSVFKIITLAMVLEENKAEPDSVFNCAGSIDVRLYDDVSTRKCWNIYGHGDQTLREAINNSCNVACVNMGLRVGARTFYKYVEVFGLFDKTGLYDAAEGRSLWWDENVFFDPGNETQLASATFGQTFKVTPIQMIMAAAATVNGGYMMQPYIVSQITDSDGNIVEAYEPTVLRQALSNETSAIIREMLEDVVKSGTGVNAGVSGYRIGGKTGTSESIEQLAVREEGDTSNKDYTVSFLGFAPADDPQIMILLLLDTPSHDTGIYISGGNMAAPVVGKMFADILPLCMDILPEYDEGDTSYRNLHVPRVTDRTVDEAVASLTSGGFNYKVIGDGDTITEQLPAPNAVISRNSVVVLYTGDVPLRLPVTVPSLNGLNFDEAKRTLENSGLFIRTAGVQASDSGSTVSVQSINAGREVPYGSIVEVTLIDSSSTERRIN